MTHRILVRVAAIATLALSSLTLAAAQAIAATITGTVTAQVGGAAINGMDVQLYTSAGVLLTTTTTNASGVYSFNGLPAGTYYVKTSAPMFPPGGVVTMYMDELFMPSFSGLPCVPCDVTTGLPIVLATAGSAVGNIDFALDIGGGLSGTVRDAGTMAPITTATVDVYDRFGVFAKSYGTFSAGTYTISGLIPGARYFARTRSSVNYADRLYNQLPCSPCAPQLGTPIVTSGGATLTGINFNLSPGGTVTGTVTDAAMSPLSGVTVQLYSFAGAGPVKLGAVTNASGVFSFTGLPTAFYVARTFVTPTQNYIDEIYNNRVAAGDSLTNGTGILITAGQTTSNVNFALDAGGSITGTVTNAQTMAPVSGVKVQVLTQRGMEVKTVTTDGMGNYALNGLPTGNYVVRTMGSATVADELYDNIPFLTGDVTTGTLVDVSAAAIHPNINFALEPGGSITGTVTAAVGGFGIGGIGIKLYDSLGRQVKTTVTTFATGQYSFTGLPAGTYYARTTNTGGYMNVLYGTVPCLHVCNPLTGTGITVATGAVTSSINFALTAGGQIRGTVTGVALGTDVRVLVFSAANELVGASQPIANNGSYVIDGGLPTGTYYARTVNTAGLPDKLYNGLTLCAPNCHVPSGTGIAVTQGNLTSNINFAMAAGIEMLQNGDFSNGNANWLQFATPDMSYIRWLVTTDQVLEFGRVPPPPGTSNQAVTYQNTGQPVMNGRNLLATFWLGNTSPLRRRISVLVHDSDFSDLAVCTFWLPGSLGGTEMQPYAMKLRATKDWTDATISFYAASTNVPQGAYRVDAVSLQLISGTAANRVDCLDPYAPLVAGGGDGPELLTNGDFGTGALAPWGTFGTITHQIAANVFEFIKPSVTPPAGVLLQPTGQAMPAGTVVTATFQLGNSSGVRKRVTVILHDNDFSDLSACTFWLPPGQALSTYTYRSYTTKAWTNATLSVYPATVGAEQWIRLDNVSFKRTPGAMIVGTECLEPGAIPPVPPLGSTASDGWTAGQSGAGSPVLQRDEAIDLTAARGATLHFRSWLLGHARRGALQISTNGVDWITMWTGGESDRWTDVEIDLRDFVGETVLVRFVLEGGGSIDIGAPALWRIGGFELQIVRRR
jgi:hypothetical protein